MTATAATEPSANISAGMEIFRFASAPTLDETGHMEVADLNEDMQAGIGGALEAGFAEGNVVKTLFSRPGFSLTYAWFKSGFPLPLHTHNADCLYYIVAGSLQLGSEKLGRGDGFFIGKDKAYRYTPGPEGVEVLEFRSEENFDIKFMAKTLPAWAKITDVIKERRPAWANEAPPSHAR